SARSRSPGREAGRRARTRAGSLHDRSRWTDGFGQDEQDRQDRKAIPVILSILSDYFEGRTTRWRAGSMTVSGSTDVQAFVAARDQLLALREDLAAATAQFRWPSLERFNWALDFFDTLPRAQTALWLVNGDGSDDRRTFGEL